MGQFVCLFVCLSVSGRIVVLLVKQSVSQSLYLVQFYQELLGVKPRGLLLECCSSRNSDIETQKAAIICIGNLSVK